MLWLAESWLTGLLAVLANMLETQMRPLLLPTRHADSFSGAGQDREACQEKGL